MTLRRKLALFLLAASLAPVAGVAFPVLSWAQREVAARVAAESLARAQVAAARASADLSDADASGAAEPDLGDPDLRARLTARLDGAAPAGAAAFLAGPGRVALASTGAAAPDAAVRAAIADRLRPGRAEAFDAAGALFAWAPLGRGGGLGVLVAVPGEVAYGAIATARRVAAIASALIVLAALGLWVLGARRAMAGVERLDAAARALAAGDLAVRVPVAGRDELARAATTFNAMAEELAAARQRLERWNEELQREVEARTRALGDAQAQLAEAQKIAAAGQLGAGVAHEINNPLTGILGNAQLLLEGMPADHAHREPLEKIEALARRCRDVTQKLVRLGDQRDPPALREVEANRVVSDALSLADGLVRAAGVEVDVALAEPSPRVRADPSHLAEALVNLVSNARTACAGKPGAGIRVSTRAGEGEVAIAVEDGGKGIAPEHLPHIFEPFFTTKDQWSDVGLGLSTTYRIVAEHGGRIDVESRVGEGSVFTVRLPALEQAA
jgi:two-component system, NtrC family, sensor kinase